MLDTDLLRSFVAVADTGSFTRAGEMVGRTQAAVSMQIKKLEEQVGKPLFIREKRQANLTGEGRVLLDRGRQILRLTEETLSALKEPEMQGVVRLAIPDDYAAAWLPPMFRDFAETHPNIVFDLMTLSSGRIVKEMRAGNLDIAIVTAGNGGTDTHIARVERLVWVKAEGSMIEYTNPLPLAVFEKNCPFRVDCLTGLDTMGRDYRIAYSSPSYSGIVGGILAGLAVSPLAESSVIRGMEVIDPQPGLLPPLGDAGISIESRPGLPPHILRIRDHIAHVLAQHQSPIDNLPKNTGTKSSPAERSRAFEMLRHKKLATPSPRPGPARTG